jgi:predicted membrane metal-binding protein
MSMQNMDALGPEQGPEARLPEQIVSACMCFGLLGDFFLHHQIPVGGIFKNDIFCKKMNKHILHVLFYTLIIILLYYFSIRKTYTFKHYL